MSASPVPDYSSSWHLKPMEGLSDIPLGCEDLPFSEDGYDAAWWNGRSSPRGWTPGPSVYTIREDTDGQVHLISLHGQKGANACRAGLAPVPVRRGAVSRCSGNFHQQQQQMSPSSRGASEALHPEVGARIVLTAETPCMPNLTMAGLPEVHQAAHRKKGSKLSKLSKLFKIPYQNLAVGHPLHFMFRKSGRGSMPALPTQPRRRRVPWCLFVIPTAPAAARRTEWHSIAPAAKLPLPQRTSNKGPALTRQQTLTPFSPSPLGVPKDPSSAPLPMAPAAAAKTKSEQLDELVASLDLQERLQKQHKMNLQHQQKQLQKQQLKQYLQSHPEQQTPRHHHRHRPGTPSNNQPHLQPGATEEEPSASSGEEPVPCHVKASPVTVARTLMSPEQLKWLKEKVEKVQREMRAEKLAAAKAKAAELELLRAGGDWESSSMNQEDRIAWTLAQLKAESPGASKLGSSKALAGMLEGGALLPSSAAQHDNSTSQQRLACKQDGGSSSSMRRGQNAQQEQQRLARGFPHQGSSMAAFQKKLPELSEQDMQLLESCGKQTRQEIIDCKPPPFRFRRTNSITKSVVRSDSTTAAQAAVVAAEAAAAGTGSSGKYKLSCEYLQQELRRVNAPKQYRNKPQQGSSTVRSTAGVRNADPVQNDYPVNVKIWSEVKPHLREEHQQEMLGRFNWANAMNKVRMKWPGWGMPTEPYLLAAAAVEEVGAARGAAVVAKAVMIADGAAAVAAGEEVAAKTGRTTDVVGTPAPAVGAAGGMGVAPAAQEVEAAGSAAVLLGGLGSTCGGDGYDLANGEEEEDDVVEKYWEPGELMDLQQWRRARARQGWEGLGERVRRWREDRQIKRRSKKFEQEVMPFVKEWALGHGCIEPELQAEFQRYMDSREGGEFLIGW